MRERLEVVGRSVTLINHTTMIHDIYLSVGGYVSANSIHGPAVVRICHDAFLNISLHKKVRASQTSVVGYNKRIVNHTQSS